MCVCVGGACTKGPHTLHGPAHGEEDQGDSGHLSVTGNDKKRRERKALPRPPSGHVPLRTLTTQSWRYLDSPQHLTFYKQHVWCGVATGWVLGVNSAAFPVQHVLKRPYGFSVM